MNEMMGVTQRISQVLGFNSLTSFFMMIAGIVFLLSLVIFFLKKPKKLAPQVNTSTKPKFQAALRNTRSGFMHKLRKNISDEDFAQIEATLFGADIGVKTSQKLLDSLREQVSVDNLKNEMRKIFSQVKFLDNQQVSSPKVILFVGVNGAGKTTSIGKLGAQLIKQNKKVILGAGDTYRAAAVKQLCVWGERIGAEVVCGKDEKSDPSSVLFDTIKQGKNQGVDIVLCDTAGRLHTKGELMDELAKIKRVVNKAHEGAPHEVFLVVDATMGQNAIMQAREFAQAVNLTGVILSKLDGTAKGGVALGIVDELKIPIRYIGIGEQPEDLREFDADDFITALFDEEETEKV